MFLLLLQLGAALGLLAAAPAIARLRKPWPAAIAATSLLLMLLWPLSRVFSVELIRLFGASPIACLELTGIIIPAALFFGLAAQRLPRNTDRRAVIALVVIAMLVVAKGGWWMVSPGVGTLGPTQFQGEVCLQTRQDTCVAASLVTVLRAHDITATEEEMARLARIERGGGATDSRTLGALERKLDAIAGNAAPDSAATSIVHLKPTYLRSDRPGLIAAPKPCLVQLRFGFFTSHMVPVMDADDHRVLIGDPLTGPREMSWPDFSREWKGNMITLTSSSSGS